PTLCRNGRFRNRNSRRARRRSARDRGGHDTRAGRTGTSGRRENCESRHRVGRRGSDSIHSKPREPNARMKNPNRATWGFLSIAIGATLFGTIGVATKGIFAVSTANAISITLWRVLIALPVLFGVGVYLLRGRLFSIRWADLRLMIVAGLLMAVYQLAFVIAV